MKKEEINALYDVLGIIISGIIVYLFTQDGSFSAVYAFGLFFGYLIRTAREYRNNNKNEVTEKEEEYLNKDLDKRVDWLSNRMTLTETDKDYIKFMMKNFKDLN